MNIKDLKVGDELECINIDAYLNHDGEAFRDTREIIPTKQLIVGSVKSDGVDICNTNFRISDDMLKFFRKKNQPKSSGDFNELIDVAVQAKKDNEISNLLISDVFIQFSRRGEKYEYDISCLANGINAIKSFYKETFVIECENDITRIKSGAVITLKNGNTVSVVIATNYTVCNAIKVDDWQCYLEFLSLKGATVEQSK